MANRGRPENLKPWRKGQSGNPGGRPKKLPLTDELRKLLAEVVPDDRQRRTFAEKIAEAVVKKAAKGNLQAVREIADRVEGKARQGIQIEGDDGKTFVFQIGMPLPKWAPKDLPLVTGSGEFDQPRLEGPIVEAEVDATKKTSRSS